MQPRAIAIASFVTLAVLCLAAGPLAQDDRSPIKPTLETLKALEGEWILLDPEGNPTDQVGLAYRVTSGGSAVLETIFPGTEHEMMTVYHMDGDDLVLTHYCHMGNQPRMKASEGSTESKILWEFVDATNLPSPDAPHMHDGTLEILGKNRLRSAWNLLENGERTFTAEFNLQRKATDAAAD